MKKILFTLLLAAAVSFSASAQVQSRVGGLLAFASDSDYGGFGLGPIAEFLLNDKMALSPNLVFYFPHKDNGVKWSLWELNANFNYYFYDDAVQLYGLAGLNFSSLKVDVDDGFGNDYEDSDTEVGLNLGLGSNFKLGGNEKLLPFAELKYVISDADQLMIYAGIKFNLK